MKNNTYYPVIILLTIVGIVLLTLGFIVNQNRQPDITPSSSLVLSPSPINQDIITEPLVTAWRVYTNEKYLFTLEVPEGWYEEDYSAHHPQGGTTVAFSPDHLPCKTCSYFNNGYFSIMVYNQMTFPERYANFLQRMKSAGKSADYKLITFKNEKGVLYANKIAIEHNGWVYELSLDKNQGKMQVADSELFQKVINSLTFTDLLFGN